MTTPCGGQTGLHAALGSALEGPGQASFFFRRVPHFCCELPSRRASVRREAGVAAAVAASALAPAQVAAVAMAKSRF